MMMGVPTFYTRLLSSPGLTRELCKRMRVFICGSAPLSPETHREFERRTGHAILERYGMTETGMICSNPYSGARVAGTVGFRLPDVKLRIVNDFLEVKGPNVFKGYWRQPEKTREDFTGDGYFITGDMAEADAAGRVTIVGRAKDLIISGGLNVYPKEVEEALDALPGVAEAAVIGVPHPDFGEGVIAVLTANGSIPVESEIVAKLGERLAKFKVPKRVFVVDDLPRNSMGKVQKALLRERYARIFTPA
jgi:malonyl-CoA/methylmalonyl-CoA synthetase